MERALLVTVKLDSEKDDWRIQDIALELEELASAAGVLVEDNIICHRQKPTPNFLIGEGKVKQIKYFCFEKMINAVIFSHDLSSVQQRNLEEVIGVKTIDRTQLILDIFAQRAKTPEGKMQVELAQLQYLLPRLTGRGTTLSRLGGGIGTRGPGEQKLEIDRRRIRERIEKLKDGLAHIKQHRFILRKQRKAKEIPQVALVGYTNAGKSSLLNLLCQEKQLVSDGLFTTLDPLSRTLKLPQGQEIVISDTVGFLHNLPHHLIEAFKATLEEVIEADLLLLVLDISNPLFLKHHHSVLAVLKELKVEEKPIITALNKIDLLDEQVLANLAKDIFVNPVFVSAHSGKNVDELLKKIQEHFASRALVTEVFIPLSRMEILDLLYQKGSVSQSQYTPEGVMVTVSLPKILFYQLQKDKTLKFKYRFQKNS